MFLGLEKYENVSRPSGINYTTDAVPTHGNDNDATIDNESTSPLSEVSTNQDNINPQSHYLEFKVGKAINFYAPPIITSVGTVANCMTLVVMTRKTHRSSSPSVYVSCLAVVDTLMLWLGLLQYWLLFNFYPQLITEGHCHAMYFVVNTINNYSAWIVVAMTTERFVAVRFPLLVASWCNIRRTRWILAVILLASILKNIHYAWTSDFLYIPETGVAMCAFALLRTGPFFRIWQWVDTCLASLIPFLLLIVMNTSVILQLRAARNQQREMMRSKQPTNGNGKEDNKGNSDVQLTVMLVSVSVTFVILTAPLAIFRSYFSVYGAYKSPHMQAVYYLSHHFCHKLWYVNNAVNFFLYCITGSRFRRELMIVFCGKVGKKYMRNESDMNTAVSTISS